jgi:3-hydroxy-5-methyl-1-naphthoate 3-O-methyltransferase
MNRIMQVGALAAAVDAAADHGIFAVLLERPAGIAELAAELDLHPVGCARVLAVLHANGLVEATGDALQLAPDLTLELMGPENRGGASKRLWEHLPRFLRTGEPVDGTDLASRGRTYSGSTPLLGRMWERPAARLADILSPRLADRSNPTVLDVGAGAGEWSLALLKRLPRARAHALDLEPVLPRYRERAESLGVADRVACSAGDFHRAEVRERFDLVVLANVLHLATPEEADRLVSRWADAVAPGGFLVIVDALSPTASDPGHAAYALHLSLRVPGGYPHLEPALLSWLAAAGMTRSERVSLGKPPTVPFGALIASRST